MLEFGVTKKKSSPWKWVFIVLLLIGLGFGSYFVMNKFFKKYKKGGCPINPRQYIESLKSQSSDDTL